MDDTTVHICSTCNVEYTDAEGGLQGLFGMIPVSFCPFCLSSLFDMVQQLTELDEDPTNE